LNRCGCEVGFGANSAKEGRGQAQRGEWHEEALFGVGDEVPDPPVYLAGTSRII
jgi:hypothetical protein